METHASPFLEPGAAAEVCTPAHAQSTRTLEVIHHPTTAICFLKSRESTVLHAQNVRDDSKPARHSPSLAAAHSLCLSPRRTLEVLRFSHQTQTKTKSHHILGQSKICSHLPLTSTRPRPWNLQHHVSLQRYRPAHTQQRTEPTLVPSLELGIQLLL